MDTLGGQIVVLIVFLMVTGIVLLYLKGEKTLQWMKTAGKKKYAGVRRDRYCSASQTAMDTSAKAKKPREAKIQRNSKKQEQESDGDCTLVEERWKIRITAPAGPNQKELRIEKKLADLDCKSLLLGRARDCDIILDIGTVSRHHLYVCYDEKGYFGEVCRKVDKNGIEIPARVFKLEDMSHLERMTGQFEIVNGTVLYLGNTPEAVRLEFILKDFGKENTKQASFTKTRTFQKD